MKNVSAGILFVLNNEKILLVHATNSTWWKSYSPPKGHVEAGESFAEAACREVKEEVGIKIEPSSLDEMITVDYTTKEGKKYKTVYLFIYKINSLDEIGLKSELLPFSMLQQQEVDHAKFMTYEECLQRILPRFINTLNYIK